MRHIMQLGLASLMVAALLSGCTKYANEDNLAALENQKQACIAVEGTVAELQTEKSDLQRELAGLKAELKAAEAELKSVQE
jgi:septal ring factor EnvC (AmiA/AmiB activator)